ncbi:helicase-associated domain-containing protein [Georgenia yuyongxinii]
MASSTTPRAATATGAALAQALARRDDAGLAALLSARPDLAVPAPSSLTALAARAGTRPSVERALTGLDAVELAVAEAAVALAPVRRPTAAALTKAVGLDAAPARHRLTDLALLVADLPVPALVEALGPHPAGLGPALTELGTAAVAPPTTAAALTAALRGAPAAAVGVLDALAWGPPVGTVGADHLPDGAAWLLEHGLLRRLSPTQLVLPREVALAARGGRTHARPPTAPAPADLRTVPEAVVEAEGARAAEEIVRLVGLLLQTWHDTPATVLRTGGIGVRELRRTAGTLEVDEAAAALVAELAAMAGLLTQEGDDTVAWAPSRAALDWLEDPLPVRWAQLVAAWLASARTPWLVGTRSDPGTLRAALEPTLERGWAVELRGRVLRVLANLPAGTAPSPAQAHGTLAWHRPRATAPVSTVGAVLDEAGRLGLTGAGALTAPGRVLLGGGLAAAAQALERALPEPVGDLLVQGDLTAVVPGRPEPGLADLLDLCAEAESRGAALTVRFTAESVRRALDAGLAADELLTALAERSRTPLPQPLEYLVRDVARRHGQLRVGAASAYLRVEDAAAAATLLGNPALADLALRTIAPTVLVSPAGPGEMLDALHGAGLAPVLEGPDGAVVLSGLGTTLTSGTTAHAGSVGRRAARARGRGRRGTSRGLPTFPGAATSTYTRVLDEADLAAVTARMRAGEERIRRDAARGGEPAPAATDPVHALAVLREAAAAGTAVEIVLVGATGRPERRRVRPVHVDGGRVRVTDLERETELTVAIHRISAVGAVPGA